MTDIGNGWIESGEPVPHSCLPCAEAECCACCGGELDDDYLRDFDGDMYCRKGTCVEQCMNSRTHDLAKALSNVLDGVHGAKDAAKTMLAKWRQT